MRILLVTVLLAVLAAVPATASGALPRHHGLQITMVNAATTEQLIDGDLDIARGVRANVVRTLIVWQDLEPRRGEIDEGRLAMVDHLMAGARSRGIKVLLSIAGTPCWNTTAPAPAGLCATPEDRATAGSYQPDDLQAFASLAAMLAARYSQDLAALELWNEPDQINELYWAGPDKVRRYAELVKLAYPAIKAASPSTPVLAGAIVGSNGKFLEALYEQGIKGSYDGLSVHYYDLVLFSLAQIRKARDKAGDRTPLWLGEFGWTSCLSKTQKREDQHACVTPAVQARNAVDVLAGLGSQKDVAAAVLYTTRDLPDHKFGVIDVNGRRKPLYTALERAYRTGRPKARKITLRLRRAGGRVIATGSGPGGDALAIYAWNGRKLRHSAVFRLDRNGNFRVRLPRSVRPRNVAVQVQRYSVKGGKVIRRL